MKALKILVTGANGFLGRSLLGLEGEAEWIGCGRRVDAGDMLYHRVELTDRAAVAALVAETNPDWVINTAAMTNVDRCEEDVSAARWANVEIVENLAAACGDTGVGLMQISTDYVFDGKASAPYKEGDQTNPQGVYGKTKLLGDLAINQSGCKYLIIRTSWVFSEYGQNFMKTMLRLGAERDELNIVADQIGCPTYGQDIAKTIVSVIPRLAINNMDSGIYHYCGDQSCSWFEFAEAIFAQATNAGFKTPDLLKPITTAEYPTPASRPAYSVLDCSKTLNEFGISPSDWREGIQEVLYKMKNIK